MVECFSVCFGRIYCARAAVCDRHRWRGHYSNPGQSLCSPTCGDQTGLLWKVWRREYTHTRTHAHTRTESHSTAASSVFALCFLRSWRRCLRRSWPALSRTPSLPCWTRLMFTSPRSWGRPWRGRERTRPCWWRSCARPPMRCFAAPSTCFTQLAVIMRKLQCF